MKKLLSISVAVAVATTISVAIATRLEKARIKRELAEKDPEELINLLNEAALVLELKQIADADEDTQEKFEKAKALLKSKID